MLALIAFGMLLSLLPAFTLPLSDGVTKLRRDDLCLSLSALLLVG